MLKGYCGRILRVDLSRRTWKTEPLAEDLVTRLAIVGRLLDPEDGKAQLLEVLATLGEEQRQVIGCVHQTFL